jgi:hypothetical protein
MDVAFKPAIALFPYPINEKAARRRPLVVGRKISNQ